MMPEELVPLAEGARRLGLAHDTARKHLSAGTLRGEKRQGRWWVWVPMPDDAGPMPDASGTLPDPLVASLQADVAYLRATLDAEIEARRRADHLVAGLMERLPELSATVEDAPVAQMQAPQSSDVAAVVCRQPDYPSAAPDRPLATVGGDE